MFKREDKYKDFIQVCESMNFISWVFCIIAFPLLIEAIRIHRLHKRIEKMGQREKWLYQKALDDGMTMVNLDTAVAFSPGRMCNYRFDIPKELKRREDSIIFSLTK